MKLCPCWYAKWLFLTGLVEDVLPDPPAPALFPVPDDPPPPDPPPEPPPLCLELIFALIISFHFGQKNRFTLYSKCTFQFSLSSSFAVWKDMYFLGFFPMYGAGTSVLVDDSSGSSLLSFSLLAHMRTYHLCSSCTTGSTSVATATAAVAVVYYTCTYTYSSQLLL